MKLRKIYPKILTPFFQNAWDGGGASLLDFTTETHLGGGSCASRRIVCVVKGKAVPLQAWSGPEASRKLRFPDFMTTAQDGGKVVRLTHRPPLPPGNTPGTHFCQS